jgi:hypothetical protein
VASVHPPPAVDEQAVHRDQATSPVVDEERPVYSSSSSEDSDTASSPSVLLCTGYQPAYLICGSSSSGNPEQCSSSSAECPEPSCLAT